MKNKLDYRYMSPSRELNLFVESLVKLKRKISLRKLQKKTGCIEE